MAPWPEQGSEPKAPDKDEKREIVEASSKIDIEDTAENVVAVRTDQKQNEEKEVLTLDEGQLKALLDEAITYKNPKDREGKSELFKELLQEAEADESDSKGLGESLGGKLPRAYYNLPVRRRQSRHGGQGRECGVGVSNTRGGSLQNLHALGMEGGRRSRRRDTLVSARQREGGSLPTNVNVDNDPDLDIICPNYTSRATLEVSSPSKEENVNSEESNALTLFKVQGHYLPNGTEPQNTKEDDSVCASYASSINSKTRKSKDNRQSEQNNDQASVDNLALQTSIENVNPNQKKRRRRNKKNNQRSPTHTSLCSEIEETKTETHENLPVQEASSQNSHENAKTGQRKRNPKTIDKKNPAFGLKNEDPEWEKLRPRDWPGIMEDLLFALCLPGTNMTNIKHKPKPFDGQTGRSSSLVNLPGQVLTSQNSPTDNNSSQRNKKQIKKKNTCQFLESNVDFETKVGNEPSTKQVTSPKPCCSKAIDSSIPFLENDAYDIGPSTSDYVFKFPAVPCADISVSSDQETGPAPRESSPERNSANLLMPPTDPEQTIGTIGNQNIDSKTRKSKDNRQSEQNNDQASVDNLALQTSIENVNPNQKKRRRRNKKNNQRSPTHTSLCSEIEETKTETHENLPVQEASSQNSHENAKTGQRKRNPKTIDKKNPAFGLKNEDPEWEKLRPRDWPGIMEDLLFALCLPGTNMTNIKHKPKPFDGQTGRSSSLVNLPGQVLTSQNSPTDNNSSQRNKKQIKKKNTCQFLESNVDFETKVGNEPSTKQVTSPKPCCSKAIDSSIPFLENDAYDIGPSTSDYVFKFPAVPCADISVSSDQETRPAPIESSPETNSANLLMPPTDPEQTIGTIGNQNIDSKTRKSKDNRQSERNNDQASVDNLALQTSTENVNPNQKKRRRRNKKNNQRSPTHTSLCSEIEKTKSETYENLPVQEASSQNSHENAKTSQRKRNRKTTDKKNPALGLKNEQPKSEKLRPIDWPEIVEDLLTALGFPGTEKTNIKHEPKPFDGQTGPSSSLVNLPGQVLTSQNSPTDNNSSQRNRKQIKKKNTCQFLESNVDFETKIGNEPSTKRVTSPKPCCSKAIDSSIPFLELDPYDIGPSTSDYVFKFPAVPCADISVSSDQETRPAPTESSPETNSANLLMPPTDPEQTIGTIGNQNIVPCSDISVIPDQETRPTVSSHEKNPANLLMPPTDPEKTIGTIGNQTIGVGPVESGAMLYPSSPMQHVSVLSIPPSQIHVGSDDHRISDSSEQKKINIARNRHKKALMPSVVIRPPEHTEEADVASEGLLGLPLTAYWNRYSSFTLLDFQGFKPDELESGGSGGPGGPGAACPYFTSQPRTRPFTLPPFKHSSVRRDVRSKFHPSQPHLYPSTLSTEGSDRSLQAEPLLCQDTQPPSTKGKIFSSQAKPLQCQDTQPDTKGGKGSGQPTLIRRQGNQPPSTKGGKRSGQRTLVLRQDTQPPSTKDKILSGQPKPLQCQDTQPSTKGGKRSCQHTSVLRQDTQPSSNKGSKHSGQPTLVLRQDTQPPSTEGKILSGQPKPLQCQDTQPSTKGGKRSGQPTLVLRQDTQPPSTKDKILSGQPKPLQCQDIQPSTKVGKRSCQSTSVLRQDTQPSSNKGSEHSGQPTLILRQDTHLPSTKGGKRSGQPNPLLCQNTQPPTKGGKRSGQPTLVLRQDTQPPTKGGKRSCQSTSVLRQDTQPSSNKGSEHSGQPTLILRQDTHLPSTKGGKRSGQPNPLLCQNTQPPTKGGKRSGQPTLVLRQDTQPPSTEGKILSGQPKPLQCLDTKPPTEGGKCSGQPNPLLCQNTQPPTKGGKRSGQPTLVLRQDTQPPSTEGKILSGQPKPLQCLDTKPPTEGGKCSGQPKPLLLPPPTQGSNHSTLLPKDFCPPTASESGKGSVILPKPLMDPSVLPIPSPAHSLPHQSTLFHPDEVGIGSVIHPTLFLRRSGLPTPPPSHILPDLRTLFPPMEGGNDAAVPPRCLLRLNVIPPSLPSDPSCSSSDQNPNTRMAFGNAADGKVKPLDENGNALGCIRMDSNCLDRKKQRRVKAKNDRNTIWSDDIEGFRGGADIDTLMEYIESPSNVLDSNKSNKARAGQANGPRNSVKVRAKEEDSRPIRRRKEKFQRCNSLEEISKTKLEDLTEESSSERVNGSSHPLTKKQVTLDDAELGKKSSWENEEEIESSCVPKISKETKQERISPEPIQDSEFHVVTKKQRKKKRRTGCSSRGGSKPDYYGARGDGSSRLLYQYRGDQGASQPRRKSASSVPPSDKSDSSDLDSVHSLPVSSTTTRTRVGKNSVSGGSTPQASYADIARTVASPPDGSQVNIYRQDKYSSNISSTEPDMERTSNLPNVMLPSCKRDAMTDTNCDKSPVLTTEDYPPLEVKTFDLCIDPVKRACSVTRDITSVDKSSFKTAVNIVIPASESGDGPHSLPYDFQFVKSPQANSNRRPPVILMDEPMVNSQVTTEITFGFEVNQQLLQCEDNLQCNQNIDLPSSVALPTSAAAKDQRSHNLPNLSQYLNAAWEETMELLHAGKARYYNDGQ